MGNKFKQYISSDLRVRLTMIQIFILASFLLFSGLTIYQTACSLVGEMNGVTRSVQNGFHVDLLGYFWLISAGAIIIGGFVYVKVTRSMLKPIQQMKGSVREIRNGRYPEPISVDRETDDIGQLVQHVNDLNQKLQLNEKLRNRMLSDMSHEIRTPLSNLRGYLEALQKGIIKGDPAIYQSLYEETQRITDLLSQIDWIREWDGSALDTMISPDLIEARELIDHVVKLYALEFQQKGIPLHVDVDTAEIYVDNRGMQQVLTNLLSNALSYYSGDEAVEIKGEKSGSDYTIFVKGPGLSIPNEQLEKIFERFYRVDTSRSRDTGGSGLGLAISKEIVDRHKGSIEVESDEHIHKFIVCLPNVVSQS
ncbi:sensor histidine kinase [Halobacillus mangrovi]|uniref:histidine kinase n=1 Tax=Halobacillus mangrovi TaxID=402384 RepID=A0A1W5ZR65_9BACI|nr:ATP-binding protein [Halobacillus mangrovi]ARI75779.1 hypothetical protein HM131_02570 [Halobacillus mangrovi]